MIPPIIIIDDPTPIYRTITAPLIDTIVAARKILAESDPHQLYELTPILVDEIIPIAPKTRFCRKCGTSHQNDFCKPNRVRRRYR